MNETKPTRDELKRDPIVKRLLDNPNWAPAAQAAIDSLIDDVECPVTSWRKSSTWQQVKYAYDKLLTRK